MFTENQTQYAISFIQMKAPSQTSHSFVILSIKTSHQEIFMQTPKKVKQKTANFFRETLFVPKSTKNFTINLYQVADQARRLIKKWEVSHNDLKKIEKRSALFNFRQDYQLQWEASLFRPDCASDEGTTQKDYSQLMSMQDTQKNNQSTERKHNFIGHIRDKTNERDLSAISTCYREDFSQKKAICKDDYQLNNNIKVVDLVKNWRLQLRKRVCAYNQ